MSDSDPLETSTKIVDESVNMEAVGNSKTMQNEVESAVEELLQSSLETLCSGSEMKQPSSDVPKDVGPSGDVSDFDQVTKGLSDFNEGSTATPTKLYTGPYGRIDSPFKKFSSFSSSSRGVKRSPRKALVPKAKKSRLSSNFDLFGSDSSSESESDTLTPPKQTPDKSCKSPEPSTSKQTQSTSNVTDKIIADTDSDDDQWQIIEDSDSEIDKKLEEKSEKYALSAINVKSIIHKIVTNEHVVEMVRKAVLEQVEERRLEYEPKMTRSKAKEVLETQGETSLPLHLSPMKKVSDESKFVDIDLPDDEEDDEDFNPEKHGSEEDSESVVSSGFSDCDTNSMPSTPTTPTVYLDMPYSASKTPTNADAENSNNLLSPMGPPLLSFVPKSQHKHTSLGQKYKDAIERDQEMTRRERELIASRTRSKCPLNEVSIVEIESNFVAPDITEDLYDTTCDDQEWKDFLKTLIVFDNNISEDTNETGGEEEDPEFDFLAEKDEYDQEDFRNDRAVKVSKKELTQLMDELYEAYNENDPIDINSKNIIKAQTHNTFVEAKIQRKQSQLIDENLIHKTGEQERLQIADQLRKHVQLLTQTYVLAMGDPEEHANIMDAAKMYLTELKNFSDRSELLYPETMFKVCNIPGALNVITDHSWNDPVELPQEEIDRMDRLTFKCENLTLPRLTYNQMKLMWTNSVFIYPELLPQGGFFKTAALKKDRSRIKFIEAEDNLLAMGLDQFRHLSNSKDYINKFMLPCKTRKQIQIRIKNLSAKTAKNNAVKYWKEHKRLPDFPQCDPICDPSEMTACSDKTVSPSVCPYWTSIFRPLTYRYDVSRQRQISISSTKSPLDTSQMELPADGQSTPVTPVLTTDSSSVKSSSSSEKSNSATQNRMRRSNLTRKKLNLDKGSSQSVPAFVPLTFSGVTNTSPSKNNFTNNITSSTLMSVCTTTVSSVQSMIIINKNLSQTQATTTSTVFSSSRGKTQNTGILTRDGKLFVVAGQNVGLKHASGSLTLGTINTNNNAANSTTAISNTSSNSSSSVSTTCVTVSVLPSVCASSTSTNNVETSSTATSSSLPVVSSKITTKLGPNGPSLEVISDETGIQSVTPVHSQHVCSQTPGSLSMEKTKTPDRLSDVSTPPPYSTLSSPSSLGNTPKTALDIMASYAPCFLSPSSRTCREQLETTPKKRSEFIKLAPKPTPPGVSPKPIDIDLYPKPRTSPRRRSLNHKAKAILPKGFVVRSFDVSPTKKAASSLIEKAKHSGKKSKSFYFSSSSGYCRILPRPSDGSRTHGKSATSLPQQTNSANSKSNKTKKTPVNEDNKENEEFVCRENLAQRTEDGLETPGEKTDGQNVEMDEEDYKGDTESDYTQSEDGNETQEEIDSQEELDSQEDDDNHIANLMEASTTTRFDPNKEDRSHLGKKDRDRDISLAMLSPDLIAADPQRDVRDTAYAQAYLHKVKKVLRDDMDTLEKFLHIMYNFSKAKESPIKLYQDLKLLFKDYPGLLHDFAGFLLREQAIECGCYNVYEEFFSARAFLRKLEIYFSKTPQHFQRIMKTFSRWYRKPGRKAKDLKSEIEPMLKGHKYLLEEFSKFFPDDQPPDSQLDEFEEIHIDGSEDEIQYDSFEEIEMLESEEILGTKLCTCECHQWKDETYRKKKKHCYRCCLTVIDGELVYRINKSIIKKINITFGPPIKACDKLPLDTEGKQHRETDNEATDQTDVDNISQHIDTSQHMDTSSHIDTIASTTDTQTDKVVDGETDNVNSDSIEVDMETESEVQTDKQSDTTTPELDSGCIVDIDGPERDHVSRVGEEIPKNIKEDESVHQSSNKSDTEVKPADPLSAEVPEKSGQLENDIVNDKEAITVNEQQLSNKRTSSNSVEQIPDTQSSEQDNQSVSEVNDIIDRGMSVKSAVLGTECTDSEMKVCPKDSVIKAVKDEGGSDNVPVRSEVNTQATTSSSDTSLANDILAAAFNAALMSEASIDSIFPFPLATQVNKVIPAKPVTVSSEGLNKGSVRIDENVHVKDIVSIPVTQPHTSDQDQIIPVSQISSEEQTGVSTKTVPVTMDGSVDTAEVKPLSDSDSSQQPFSPFSPFGQEIQSIIKSPAHFKQSTLTRVRRITPIPVTDLGGDDQSFQSVVQNSPVITDVIQSPLGQIVCEKSREDSLLPDDKKACIQDSAIPKHLTEVGSNSGSRGSTDTVLESQKSVSSDKSVESFQALKISQPALFSEDANVGFTKPTDFGNITSHISEESLLQCLAKPSHFNDTIGTVSNLTNILNALDDKSILHPGDQGKMSDGKHSSEASKVESEHVICETKNDVADSESFVSPLPLNVKGNGEPKDSESERPQALQEHKALIEGSNKDMSENSDSSEGKSQSGSNYYPQSIQSIENLERLKTGLFTVTSLSDSESSANPTPSTSNTHLVLHSDKDKKSSTNPTASTSTLLVQHSDKVNLLSDNESYTNNTDLVKHSDNTNQIKLNEELNISSKNEKEIDNNSTEASDDNIQTQRMNSEVKEQGDFTVYHHTECMSAKEAVPHTDNTNENTNNTLASVSTSQSVICEEIQTERIKVSDCIKNKDTGVHVKNSHSDKIKKKKKKKHHEHGDESPSSSSHKKKKKKTHKDEVSDRVKEATVVNNQDREQSSQSHQDRTGSLNEEERDVQNVMSEPHTETPQPGPSTQPQTSPCSSSHSPKPVWTKETDRIILETCKVSGEKEKTFVKIAKLLQNVTPKQVRKRFRQLCQLIFKKQGGPSQGPDS